MKNMGNRKELKNIAGGILSSFMSRNNDADGYWALGKLYKEYGERKVTLNLLDGTITPATDLFGPFRERWQFKFSQQLARRQIPIEWVGSATIHVTSNALFVHELHHWAGPLGNPCTCVCEILTDTGTKYTATRGTRCWPHDPSREGKSTRLPENG